MSASVKNRRFNRFLRLIQDGNWMWFFHRLRLKVQPFQTYPSMAPLFTANSLKSVLLSPSSIPGDVLSGLKVVFFSHNLKREGASISLLDLVSALKSRFGVCPHVAAFEDGPLREVYEGQGVSVEIISSCFDELTTQKRLNRLQSRILEILARTKAQAVFANTLPSFPAILAAHQAGLSSLWNIREGASGESFFRVLPERIAREALSCAVKAHKTIFVSNASRSQWNDYEALGRFQVIHNALKPGGFDARAVPSDKRVFRKEWNLLEDSVVFLCAGSVEARKGQVDLIEAFKTLPEEQRKKTEVVIAGDLQGEYARQLIRSCEGTGIFERVHFLDSTQRIASLYAAADVFVLCSRSESYPRVILEAMASGLPVITTPVDGVVEQVKETQNAFFYNPFDFKTLSATMERLISRADLRSSMGKASQEIYFAMPDFDSMLKQYAASIRDLCPKESSF